VKSAKYIFLILVLIAVAAAADTTEIAIGWDGTDYYPPDQGPQIALALSGGGARGISQVGILRAFEESGIRISAIAGTSIGGIVGGLYASGYDAKELDEIVRQIDFDELFSNRPSRTTMLLTQREERERYLLSIRFDGHKPFIPQAITTGQNLSDLLILLTLKANYISGGDFTQLKIPFSAVTTDLITGDKVVIREGNLADAMRSTMAFPLAFTGVETGEMVLMDGGMVEPVPVPTVAESAPGLDLLVAVNTTSDLLPKDRINDPLAVANQATSIMTMDKLEVALDAADIVIEPDIHEYNSADFDKIDELIEIGYRAGLKAAGEIYDKCSYLCSSDTVYISSININASGIQANRIEMSIDSGMIVTTEDIRQAANDLYRRSRPLSISVRIIGGRNMINGIEAVDIEIDLVASCPRDNLELVIYGNTIFDDSAIAAIMPLHGASITAEDMLFFSDSLVKLYESRGYNLAHIRSLGYHPDDGKLIIDLDEAKVRRIMILGNEHTKQWLIKSNYPQRVGEPFNSKKARKGIANIYATGLFDRVIVNVVPDDEGAIVRVTVKEKKYTQVRLGWHLHDRYKNETFIELLNDNLFGTGQELLSHLQYADRRQKYELTLKADRFFSTYFTYNLSAYYHFKKQDLYDSDGEIRGLREEDRYGAEFTMGHQISRFGTVSGSIGITEVENEYSPDGSSDRIKLRTLAFESRGETINRYPFPTRGGKLYTMVQFATDILGAEDRYTKFFGSLEAYRPLFGGLNFHPTISLGLSDAESGIPFSERFYIGGHYSFYGYAYDELVGSKMILGNFELRLALPHRFYLYGRYDFGQVYGALDDIKIKNLRHGYGFSLAFDSPLGPVDFGYGKSGNHPDRWYVDIGLAF